MAPHDTKCPPDLKAKSEEICERVSHRDRMALIDTPWPLNGTEEQELQTSDAQWKAMENLLQAQKDFLESYAMQKDLLPNRRKQGHWIWWAFPTPELSGSGSRDTAATKLTAFCAASSRNPSFGVWKRVLSWLIHLAETETGGKFFAAVKLIETESGEQLYTAIDDPSQVYAPSMVDPSIDPSKVYIIPAVDLPPRNQRLKKFFALFMDPDVQCQLEHEEPGDSLDILKRKDLNVKDLEKCSFTFKDLLVKLGEIYQRSVPLERTGPSEAAKARLKQMLVTPKPKPKAKGEKPALAKGKGSSKGKGNGPAKGEEMKEEEVPQASKLSNSFDVKT